MMKKLKVHHRAFAYSRANPPKHVVTSCTRKVAWGQSSDSPAKVTCLSCRRKLRPLHERVKAVRNAKIDAMVNQAMFEAGGGDAVSVLRTAHVLNKNDKFKALIGATGKGTQAFDVVRKVTRESMERMYGTLVRVVCIAFALIVSACAPAPRQGCHVMASQTTVVPIANGSAECAGDWFAVGVNYNTNELRCAQLTVTCWLPKEGAQ